MQYRLLRRISSVFLSSQLRGQRRLIDRAPLYVHGYMVQLSNGAGLKTLQSSQVLCSVHCVYACAGIRDLERDLDLGTVDMESWCRKGKERREQYSRQLGFCCGWCFVSNICLLWLLAALDQIPSQACEPKICKKCFKLKDSLISKRSAETAT